MSRPPRLRRPAGPDPEAGSLAATDAARRDLGALLEELARVERELEALRGRLAAISAQLEATPAP